MQTFRFNAVRFGLLLAVLATLACSPGAALRVLLGGDEEPTPAAQTGNPELSASSQVSISSSSSTPAAEPTPTALPEPEPVEPEPTEALVEVEPTPEPDNDLAVKSLQDVKQATIRIVAKGEFTYVDDEGNLQPFDESSGSGFIIDESGIAVTNSHVVIGGSIFNAYIGGDDQPYRMRVLGISECSDLAVLQLLGGEEFPYLTWYEGNVSPPLTVLTAGFPLGDSEFTMTRGIVSKAKTSGQTSWASVDSVLEHDATINPGNSGGPLVSEEGQIVGVNYASNSATNQYFAIAREEALEVIEQLRAGRNVHSLGISAEAVSIPLDDGTIFSGIWVSSVNSGSPADEAGIKPGDFITRLENVAMAADGSMNDYCEILRTRNPEEETITFEVVRLQTEECLRGQVNGRKIEVVDCVEVFSSALEVDPEQYAEDNPDGPTGSFAGVINSNNVNVRSGPGTDYERVAKLNQGDSVTVLQRTQSKEWVEVAMADKKKGWTSAQFINMVEARLDDVPIAATLPPKPEVPSGGSGGGGVGSFTLWGNNLAGGLGAGGEQWYSFNSNQENQATLIAFVQGTDQFEMIIYHGKNIPAWPPKDVNLVPNVGVASKQGNRDQNDRTVEFVWQGPVEKNTKYYVRLVNRGGSAQYCIVTRPDRYSC
ncbi:MAG TPA: trypsin-like peptidase domain-containing protein [Anaerolineae bacterium]|nr:trypsin-like peptidase domain-containing protein [Anaerolineae bacterium]